MEQATEGFETAPIKSSFHLIHQLLQRKDSQSKRPKWQVRATAGIQPLMKTN